VGETDVDMEMDTDMDVDVNMDMAMETDMDTEMGIRADGEDGVGPEMNRYKAKTHKTTIASLFSLASTIRNFEERFMICHVVAYYRKQLASVYRYRLKFSGSFQHTSTRGRQR
jgi:hypothetical protein